MTRRRSAPARAVSALALLVLAGCITPTTRPPVVTAEQIEAERRRQRVLVLEHIADHQDRLARIAYPLLRAAVPFCDGHAMPWPGFRPLFAGAFQREWRDAARDAYGLTDTLVVFSITPDGPADRAGLRPGDVLVSVGDHTVGPGAEGSRALYRWLRANLPGRDTLVVRYRRSGAPRTAALRLETVCAYETGVVPSLAINAWADGTGVYVTLAMMRFAADDELAAIVAHEIAHNAMGHVAASMHNAAVAGLFGLVADLSILLSGDTLPEESNTGWFMARGARAFSRDFEREADYVGLYILARAGRDPAAGPRIFRTFAIADPDSNPYSGSHPSHTERFLLLEAAIREIEDKRAAGEPLLPEG